MMLSFTPMMNRTIHLKVVCIPLDASHYKCSALHKQGQSHVITLNKQGLSHVIKLHKQGLSHVITASLTEA